MIEEHNVQLASMIRKYMKKLEKLEKKIRKMEKEIEDLKCENESTPRTGFNIIK
jgi:DNA repair ATPase RecN